MSPIKVIDIIGNMRSGSTVLNILLGAHPNIIAVGEIQHVTKMKQHELQCSCGESFDCCDFWQNVISRWLAQNSMDDVEVYRRMQRQYERYRKLPHTLFASKHMQSEFVRYAQATYGLYEAVTKESQTPVIAASSKHPARAYAMNNIEGLDMHYIFLVRDVRGYAASCKRLANAATANPLPVWKTALTWVFTNMVSESLIKRTPQSTMVRYEDLVSAPGDTLRKIGQALGEDMNEVATKIDCGEGVPIEHLLSGNRLRMQKELRVKRSADTWDQILTPSEAETAWRIAGWMMKRYGYVKD